MYGTMVMVEKVGGKKPSLPSSSIPVSTSEKDGLMSKEDKAKLDSMENNAQPNTIDYISINGRVINPTAFKTVEIDLSPYATKEDLENLVVGDIDLSNYFTKPEVNDLLNNLPTTGEENVIDSIAINNRVLPVHSKRVNLPMDDYVSKAELDDFDLYITDEIKIQNIAIGSSDNPLTPNEDKQVVIPTATDTQAGLMSKEDKAKLDNLDSTGSPISTAPILGTTPSTKEGAIWVEYDENDIPVLKIFHNGVEIPFHASAPTLAWPRQIGTLTYNRKAQTPEWENYDPTYMTMNVEPATDAGSHTGSFTTIRNAKWPDNTTGTKNFSWEIKKAPGTLEVSDFEMSGKVNEELILSIANNSGDVSFEIADSTIATAELIFIEEYNEYELKITLTSIGTTNITVKSAESTNYLETAVNIEISCTE